jgi:hypothetical protein
MNAEYQRLEAEASDVTRRMMELSAGAALRSSVELAGLETELAGLGRRLASLHLGMALVRSVASPELARREREFVESLPVTFHSQGTRTKKVVLPGGVTVELEVRYFHRKKHPTAFDRGRRGLFPALLLLGIQERFPPGVRMRMANAAALLGSYEEAATMLAGEGIVVCVNTLRKVTAGLGRMLKRLTQQGLLKVAGTVAGRRIVVTMDGGRVRLRERRKGKTKKGRQRFSPQWREPRLFVIYAVDENGRQADDFPPIIDGSMGSCDEFFGLLQAHLSGLGISEAARVLFVADGAAWIWRRVPKLIKALGLKDGQVRQLIDFWHAVEYLGKLAESKQLAGSAKKRWLTTQKNRLLRGEIGSVVDELKKLVGPRPTKNQRTWLNYFKTNGLTHRRMDYSISRDQKTPIGSGAVESAVRRVINLRVKSNATYWLRENAETMIRLRGWIKAGRGEELFRQTTCITPQLAL